MSDKAMNSRADGTEEWPPDCPNDPSHEVKAGYDEETDYIRCAVCNETIKEWRNLKVPEGSVPDHMNIDIAARGGYQQ